MPANLFLPTSTGTFKKVDVSLLSDLVDKVTDHPEVQKKLKQIEAGEEGIRYLYDRHMWIFGIAPSIGSHPIVKTTLQELVNMAHIKHSISTRIFQFKESGTLDSLQTIKNRVGGEFSDFSVEIAENFVGDPYYVFKYLDIDLYGNLDGY